MNPPKAFLSAFNCLGAIPSLGRGRLGLLNELNVESVGWQVNGIQNALAS
jgi:hypothetical protein